MEAGYSEQTGAPEWLDVVSAVWKAPPGQDRKWLLMQRVVDLLGASAASAFILDAEGRLQPVPGARDNSRQTYGVHLDLWPNVCRALSFDRPVRLSASEAQALETTWFEPGGISSCICAPIRGLFGSGVLFLDFIGPVAPRLDEMIVVEIVAAIWSAWLDE